MTTEQVEALRRAAQLRAVPENQQVPAGAEGAGPAGAVLGPDGVPAETRKVGPPPAGLGEAVDAASASSPPCRWQTGPGPEPAANPRPLDEIAEDVIAALADALRAGRTDPAKAPPNGPDLLLAEALAAFAALDRDR